MLLENKISAVTLSEPLITFAQINGCQVIIDDSQKSLCYLVLVAHDFFINKEFKNIKTFLSIYNNMVDEINNNPEEFRKELLQNVSYPTKDTESLRVALLTMAKAHKSIMNVVPIPKFSYCHIPYHYQIDQVLAWIKSKNLIIEDTDISYDNLIADPLLFD